ncbi:glycosyltransferase [Dehalococcoidia bacterium]|nr:glycosyltransferase [Dehalococcoidia bacterium]
MDDTCPRKNMNILQVIPYFVPAWNSGGPLIVCYDLSKELVRRGHRVSVYTTDVLDGKTRIREKEETIDGILVKRFKNLSNSITYKYRLFISPSMISVIRNNLKDFDVVHLHDYYSIQSIIVHHYAKKYNIPYVLQAHGSLTTFFQKGMQKRIFNAIWGYRILRDTSKVIAITKTEAEQYKSMGVNKNKIEIVPNGIDLFEFDNLPARGEFRKKWGINDSQKVILYLARIHKIKGPDLLAKAFAELLRNLNNVKLVIAGPNDGYLPSLKKSIADLEISNKVLFTGPLYGEDKLKAYVDADIYVLPSIYETFPISVLEACACGTPVIVTDRCGIADVIDGRAGLVVPYDKDQLRDAVLHMIGNDILRREFGEKGRLLVRERFNWEKIAEQMGNIYVSCHPSPVFQLPETKMNKERTTIGIVTSPLPKASKVPISNLVNILCSFSDDIQLITGGTSYGLFMKNKKVHAHEVKHRAGLNAFTRIRNYAKTQLKISYKLAKLSKNVDLWIFFIGGESLILPILTAKLLRKKVVIALAGSGLKVAQIEKDHLYRILAPLMKINYTFSNRVILYSPNLIKEWNLEKYRNKISIAHEHFLDFDKFRVIKRFDERTDLIGYIGGLGEAKGVLNFVKAIPAISRRKSDLEFLIGGDGQLRDEIEEYLESENLNDKVNLGKWIPHNELPNYMNELKLLVLPSYTEGLPNIMLEAMACGTPVLATSVGAIPDVIKDGETGFIMENNSPECIAENVIRALNHSNLEQITKNARALMEREFTYEKAVERYRQILDEVSRGKA